MHIVFTKPEWESREVVYYKPRNECEPHLGYDIIVKIGEIYFASHSYLPDEKWEDMRIGRGGNVLPWAKIVTSFDPYDEDAAKKAFETLWWVT